MIELGAAIVGLFRKCLHDFYDFSLSPHNFRYKLRDPDLDVTRHILFSDSV